MSDIHIDEATDVTDDLVAAFARLVAQLSSSAPPPSRAHLERIVGSPATRLLIAHSGTDIVGTLTLVLFPIPTGTRAWIEDVVVDEGAARQGIATRLVKAALELATEHGAQTVDLTSRPSRVAANRLYQKLGFVARETNVYRFTRSNDA